MEGAERILSSVLNSAFIVTRAWFEGVGIVKGVVVRRKDGKEFIAVYDMHERLLTLEPRWGD